MDTWSTMTEGRCPYTTEKANTTSIVYLFACFCFLLIFPSLCSKLYFIVCFPWPFPWQISFWELNWNDNHRFYNTCMLLSKISCIYAYPEKRVNLKNRRNVDYRLKQWAAVRTQRGAMRAPPHCWTDCPISKRATCQGHCPGHCLNTLPSGWLGGVGCFRVPHPGDYNGTKSYQTV